MSAMTMATKMVESMKCAPTLVTVSIVITAFLSPSPFFSFFQNLELTFRALVFYL